jgi:hypothetical protein
MQRCNHSCRTPPSPRQSTLADLKNLRQTVIATPDEVLALIERERQLKAR